MRIADIIDAPKSGPGIKRRLPRLVELMAPPPEVATKPPADYGRRVFTHLVEDRAALGITRVYRAHNLLVDGGVVLTDGRFMAAEIKYRMNWPRACQAGWQFSEFARSAEAREHGPAAGIVFFEEFTGDWARQLRGVERGWLNWYDGHCVLPAPASFRVDLVRFREGALEVSPSGRETNKGGEA